MDLVIRIIWNHHESATQKKVEFEIWIIRIFHFFVMNITMKYCLAAYFILPNLFRFHWNHNRSRDEGCGCTKVAVEGEDVSRSSKGGWNI